MKHYLVLDASHLFLEMRQMIFPWYITAHPQMFWDRSAEKTHTSAMILKAVFFLNVSVIDR